MTKMLTGMLAALAVLAVACGGGTSSKDKTATTVAKAPATAAASTNNVTVFVDGSAPTFNSEALAYFPNELKLHAGDTIQFKLRDSGAPHTVTFGSYVDAVQKVISDVCGPEGIAAAKCSDGPPPPEFDAAFGKLPQLLPEGPGDANQAAANPCFLASGDAPESGPCPKASSQPDFDGTQTLFSSGWLGSDTFTLKLSSNIQAGTYTWICLLHGPEMTGKLTVVDKGTAVPSADEVKKQGDERLDNIVKALQPGIDRLAKGTADKAFAGGSDPEVHNASIIEFGPKELSIPVGGSVSWAIDDIHTISFNATEELKSLRVKAADGTIHLNAKSPAPAGGAGQTPPDENAPPPSPDAPPTVIDGGTFDGAGFHSSGFIAAFGGPVIYKLTFSKAGTYTYKCLIHDKMEGKVKVGS